MRKIVVLDDDQVILDLLQTVLTDAGYDTILERGPEAVPSDATADLVITDLVPLKAYQRERALGWVSSLRSRFVASPAFILTAPSADAAEPDIVGAQAIRAIPFDR